MATNTDYEQRLINAVNSVDSAKQLEENLSPLLDVIARLDNNLNSLAIAEYIISGKASISGTRVRQEPRSASWSTSRTRSISAARSTSTSRTRPISVSSSRYGARAAPNKKYKNLVQILKVLSKRIPRFSRFNSKVILGELQLVMSNSPWATHPSLLLPVRLETRFKDEYLCVRIYPDQLFINNHDERISSAEYAGVKQYADTKKLKKRDAWRKLAKLFGSARASWLVSWAKSHDFSAQPPQFQEDSGLTAPKLAMQPYRYHVKAYRDGEIVYSKMTLPVEKDRTILARPNSLDTEGLFDSTSKWMVDFNVAVNEGLALKIPINDDDKINGFDRVIVVGIQWSNVDESSRQLKELLEAQRYSQGLSFLAPGTQTNNTETAASNYSSIDDVDAEYDAMVTGPSNWSDQSEVDYGRKNAYKLASALGIEADEFRFVSGAADTSNSFASEINQITWQVTGDYYFRYLLPDTFKDYQLKYIADHQKNFVRACGPLPSIRIGKQPYGVLPVTHVSSAEDTGFNWVEWDEGDTNHQNSAYLDKVLHSFIYKLYKIWLGYANDKKRVPRVMPDDQDPDSTLLKILSMQSHSISYRSRAFVDERFIVWLLEELSETAFGEDPVYKLLGLTSDAWATKWSESWLSTRSKIADLLSSLSNQHADNFKDKPLLRILSWLSGVDSPIAYVNNPDETNQQVSEALKSLCEDESISAETLMTDVFQRSLNLSKLNNMEGEIVKAICNLTSQANEVQPDIERLFKESLDLVTHRVDAWVTSFATKRLHQIRSNAETKEGVHIGVYGFVENLRLREEALSEGYLHAPSAGQSATAAVLYNAYLTHDPNNADDQGTSNPFRINLTSSRVNNALKLLEGVRQGQALGSLLGYQFERDLKDRDISLAQHIGEIRNIFPLVANKIPETAGAADASTEYMAARNVVDGMALVIDYRKLNLNDNEINGTDRGVSKVGDFLLGIDQAAANKILAVLEVVENSLDSIGDLLTTESVYQAVQGNYERAAAAMESASGNQPPLEIESIKTPAPGKSFTHRVCTLFNNSKEFDDESSDPRGAAEPRIAAWFYNTLGSLESIGTKFSFIESASERININVASAYELITLPGITMTIAEAIIEDRIDNGLFASLAEMQRVRDVDGVIVGNLRSLASTSETIERVDLNSASEKELITLPHIGPEIARDIINRRPYKKIRELDKVDKIRSGRVNLEKLRPLITAGLDQLNLQELEISSSDFLYIAQSVPESGATELEVRIARIVRKEYSLPENQLIKIHAAEKGAFTRSLADAAELSQQALKLLATGQVMSATTMSHPASSDNQAFTSHDVSALRARVVKSQKWLNDLRKTDRSDQSFSADKFLMQASKFSISGAVPVSNDDPFLKQRLTKTLAEFDKRYLKSVDLMPPLNINTATQIEDLISSMKALFGKSYIVLPTFVPEQASELNQCFTQDAVNGLGEERLRLWMQQSAEVRQNVAELEDTIMFSDAWMQSIKNEMSSSLKLNVAQLPYTIDRFWLALSDEERRGENPLEEWARSPLSVFVSSDGDLPEFIDDLNNEARVVTAGLLLDEWNELIPDSDVNTSVAFQYDAPNAQAPQSLLLAVPGQMKEIPGLWTPDSLADIVNDTIDLAKVRAVDIDALAEDKSTPEEEQKPMGAILPGIFLPTDPRKPGWARDAATDTLDEWLATRIDVPTVIDESIYMYGSLIQEGLQWVSPQGLRVSNLSGQEFLYGMFESNSSDSGTVMLSEDGIRIELPRNMIRVDVSAGWLNSADRKVVMRDASNNILNVTINEAEWSAPQAVVKGRDRDVLGKYSVFDYTLVAPEIKSIEIRGSSLINHITTYINE